MGMLIYGIVFMLPLAMIVTAVLYLPVWLMRRGERLPVLRHMTMAALLCYSLIVLWITLFLSGFQWMPGYHMYNLQPFIWLFETYSMGWTRMIEQLCLNVVLFIPLGVLLPMNFQRLRRWYATALCGLGITVVVEVVQYFSGRSADIDDVIMNALGGLIGYAVYALAKRLFSGKRWWQRLSGAAQIA